MFTGGASNCWVGCLAFKMLLEIINERWKEASCEVLDQAFNQSFNTPPVHWWLYIFKAL
jgi:hypothetical protein